MALLGDTVALVQKELSIYGDDTELIASSTIMDILSQGALPEFSSKVPRIVSTEYVGNSEYNRELPSTWLAHDSVIHAVFDSNIGQGRGDYDINNIMVVEDVDETARGVATVSSGATSATFSTVANAGYYRVGDVIEIKNNSALSGETNWASANGNTTTGVLTIKNAAAATYSSTPVIRKKPHIRFITQIPGTSDYFTIKHTGIHIHTDTQDTIPSKQYWAFVLLCCALTARSLAARFAKHTDSTFSSDAVDYSTHTDKWQTVADKFMEDYLSRVGAGDDVKVKAAAIFVDLDTRDRFGRSYPFNTQYQ